MTVIHDLPQELLPVIFETLDSRSIIQAQNVCRAWYLPAHITLLESIALCSGYEIEKFVGSIDENTYPTYLAAVQSIEISTGDCYGVHYHFDKTIIEKLFCRFPNLKYVLIESYSDYLEEFDEELCQTIARKCPESDFQVVLFDQKDEIKPLYCNTMYKLRLLVTNLDLDEIGSASEFGGITKFIASFPRLRQTYSRYTHLNSFRDYLLIFTQLSNLKKVDVRQGSRHKEEENFAERYLASVSKEQRDLIIERLSKVIELTYDSKHPFCPNTIKFIAKYFTGLKKLTIDSTFNYDENWSSNWSSTWTSLNNDNWTTVHQQVLLNELTSLGAEYYGYIAIHYLKLPVLGDVLPTVVRKVFSRPPFKNKVLTVDVHRYYEFYDMAHLAMRWSDTARYVTISFSNQLDIYETLTTLLNSQYHDVNQFVFRSRDKARCTAKINIDVYNTVLEALPAVKEITLDIPKSFKNRRSNNKSYQHTHIETVTLRPTSKAKFRSLLDTYSFMFPNLKYLNLYYYSGIWKRNTHDMYINLRNYTLERLVVDMTPARRMIKARPKTVKGDFFVVQVESSKMKERYKISLDLSKVTRVNEEDNQNLYFCVHIIIESLQSLEAYIYKVNIDDDNEEYLNYTPSPYLKHIVIFNKN